MRSAVNTLRAGPAGAVALNAVAYLSMALGRPVNAVLTADVPWRCRTWPAAQSTRRPSSGCAEAGGD